MPKIAALGSLSSRGFGEFAQQTAANYIEDVFSTYLYTNNTYPSNLTITNNIDLANKGGLVWCKNRGLNRNHNLYDTVRGAYKELRSDALSAEITNSTGTGLTSFNNNGFSLGTDIDGENYGSVCSWTFRKQLKFFDVITYTGDGVSGRTVNHNLGSTPGFIITKRTDAATNWLCYHRSLGFGAGTYTDTNYIVLNSTSASNGFGTAGVIVSANSTTFSPGASANFNGGTYVAYLFAHDAGGFGADGSQNVISCGSYTGNGSTTGPVINLGYEPQYVLIKKASAAGGWVIFDTMRGLPVGNYGSYLLCESSAAEVTNYVGLNVSATGFQPNQTDDYINGSGGTYIYMAIRRGPMRTPTSGTSVFSPIAATTGTQTTSFPIDMQIEAWRTNTSAILNSQVVDRLRGVSSDTTNKGIYLLTSATSAENTSTNQFSSLSWNNTGFKVPQNYDGGSNIFWSFARAPGFFDVVCYTGTGSAATINHNLGVVPEMIIVKGRNAATDWPTYHTGLNGGVTPEQWYVRVNSTTAQTNAVANWNNTAPTSTVFSVGGNNIGSGTTFVAYLFATCPGVSKVGSYTGTGATQTISCGFTGGARFVLIKRADGVASWWVWDTARGMVAGTDPRLALNNTNAEANANWVYTTTGGFQIVTSDTAINASGGTYIYLAIA